MTSQPSGIDVAIEATKKSERLAMREVFGWFDDMMSDGRFSEVDLELTRVASSGLPPSVMLTFVMSTAVVPSTVLPSKHLMIKQVREVFEEQRGMEEANDVFDTLTIEP